MTLKSDAWFEEKLICCSKNDKNLVKNDLSTGNSQNFYFDWFLTCKVYIFWPKKLQRIYLLWHWRMMQNLSKIDLWFGKLHEEYGRFPPEHLNVSKLELWWDPFIQSRKCMSLKLPEELCVMTMKNDGKFGEELIVVSKLTWGIWRILTRELKYFKNVHFNKLLSNKVYNVWPKKVPRSYVSWYWRVIQNLKKNWLVIWKMTWRIWQIFTRALESLKIGTLMGSFYPK